MKRYINESNFDIFVFCENTGYQFRKDEIKVLAHKSGKIIEFLSFVSNIEMVNKLGKGYGEGECIEYAINKSKFLQDDEVTFFKITGRLFVENINEIINKNLNKTNCFLTDGLNTKSVKTVFFKAKVSFFKFFLLEAYKKVIDAENKFLEYIYFENLIDKKVNGLAHYPNINGNSGSTGKPYILESEYNRLNFLNKLNAYKLNRDFFI